MIAFGDLAIKIQARNSAIEKASFNRALKRLLDLLDEQPARSLDLARPLQRVRQDFEWALVAKDAEGSQRYFEELTANGRLSQENVWYLQIQRWASLELWNEIIQHPDIADLLYLRRPTKVTYSILRAFSSVYLNDKNLDRTELAELLNKEPLLGIRDIRILVNDRSPSDVVHIYQQIKELLSYGVTPNDDASKKDTLYGFALAQNLWETGQFVDALETLKSCPDDASKMALTLRICHEVPSPNVISVAIQLRNALPSEVLDVLKRTKETAELLHWLTEQTLDDNVPLSLVDWVNAFEKNFTDSQLEDIFREQSESWNIDLLTLKETAEISALMELAFDTPRSNLLLRMLPCIHEEVANLEPIVKAPILRSCFFILAIQDQLTTAELGALHHVVDNLFDIVNVEERDQILNEIVNIWARIANPRRMAWFLDLAASIKATAGPNDARSNDVIIQMASVVAGFMPGSLEENYKLPAKFILSGVYDLDAWTTIWQVGPSDTETTPDPFRALTNKSVGIYCLEQTRAMRMSDALEAICACSISLNHQYVGSEALENISKSSDLMVVVTSAAKHAATECIRVNRGDKPTVYVHSTGVSTFLRSIEAFLNQQG
jgi:hypothetical protein